MTTSPGEKAEPATAPPKLPEWFTTEGSKWRRLRKLGVLANVDPRTVEKEVVTPGSVRGEPGDRVRRVLKDDAESEVSP